MIVDGSAAVVLTTSEEQLQEEEEEEEDPSCSTKMVRLGAWRPRWWTSAGCGKYVVAGLVGLFALIVALTFVLPISYRHKAIILRSQGLIIVQVVIFAVSARLWKIASSFLHYKEDRLQHETVAKSTEDSAAKKCAKLIFKGFLLVFLFLSQFSFVFSMFLHGTEPHWLAWISLACFGTYVQFVPCYFITRQLASLFSFIQSKIVKSQFPKKKKSFAVLYISLLYTIAICTYGLYNGSRLPVVKKVNVTVEGFPKAMDGTNIVLLSDIHFGSTVGRSKLQSAVDIVNSLTPDIIAVVGDLADGPVHSFREGIQPLSNLRSRKGKFFVSGNHEYYNGDVDNWFEHLRSNLGFTVLHNSHVEIKDKGEFFYLAGTDDIEARTMRYGEHGMDLDKAVGSCDAGRPVVLLAHQPKAAKEAIDSKYNIQLVLSGHTHGGQMMPMTIFAYLINPFFAGLYSYNSRQVYVGQGTLYWGIPMRMFSESEVVQIFLRSHS